MVVVQTQKLGYQLEAVFFKEDDKTVDLAVHQKTPMKPPSHAVWFLQFCYFDPVLTRLESGGP